MASTAARVFVGFVVQEHTVQPRGAAGHAPLSAGQMIIAHGTFTDGSPTGPGVFMVLRQVSAYTFKLAPIGTDDGDWAKWLRDRSSVTAILWRDPKEAVPENEELLRRWSVVSQRDEVPQKKDYEDLFKKKVVDGIPKKWEFLNDLMVADTAPPQAVTVPFCR